MVYPVVIPENLKKPKYLFMTKDNNIAITDTWNQRIQIMDTKGEPVDLLSTDFFGPKGIAIYDDKYIVADTGHHSIKVLSNEGEVISEFGNKKGKSKLHEPTGLTVDNDGNIYIVDSINNRVAKFNKHFEFVKDWKIKPWAGNDRGKESFIEFYDGKIYVTDPVNSQILVYSTEGTEYEPVLKKLGSVSGIKAHKGKLYVVDFGIMKVLTVDLKKG